MKKGQKVKLKNEINLVSLLHLKGKELIITNFVKTGLISQPEFIEVNCEGDTLELSPDFVNLLD